ncbi:MAG: hypothetical protein WHS44_09555 [Fimbriimonadales bacterium]|nr:MAG: hypothetical protein KatS3mg018_0230 [Fimbriimonadales bacterium]
MNIRVLLSLAVLLGWGGLLSQLPAQQESRGSEPALIDQQDPLQRLLRLTSSDDPRMALPNASETAHRELLYEERAKALGLLINRLRQIGLQRDRSQAQWVLKALQPEVVRAAGRVPTTRHGAHYLQVAALLALARLAAPETLPTLQSPEFQQTLSANARTYLPVIIARIQVENQFPTVKTAAEWEAKMQAFRKAVDLPREQWASVLEAYEEQVRTVTLPEMYLVTRELFALRQLADMAADATAQGVRDAFQPFETLGSALEKDEWLWFKVQFGKQPEAERISWLVRFLAGAGVRTMRERYAMQALVDCGVKAAPIIAQSLRQSERTILQQRMLLEVLSVIDSPESVNLLENLAGSGGALSEEAKWLLAQRHAGRASVVIFAPDYL